MRSPVVFAVAAAIVCVGFGASPARGQENARRLRLYTVGNSLTDHLNHDAFEKGLKAQGWDAAVGKHMIPGSPLFLLWRTCEKGENAGFTRGKFGASWPALDGHEWDAVTLQPFDRGLHDMYAASYVDGKPIDPGVDPQGDLVYAQKYLDRVWAKSPNARVYIYARNPRMTINGRGVKYDKNNYGKPSDDPEKITDYSKLDPWEKRWGDPAKNRDGEPHPESREYFELLTKSLRNCNRGRPIYMIPVGHVMSALGKKIEANEAAGLTNVFDLYTDGIHLGPAGRYLVGCTFYATICREDPKNLPADLYGVTDEKLAEVIRRTAWEVVRENEFAGVAKEVEPLAAPQK